MYILATRLNTSLLFPLIILSLPEIVSYKNFSHCECLTAFPGCWDFVHVQHSMPKSPSNDCLALSDANMQTVQGDIKLLTSNKCLKNYISV